MHGGADRVFHQRGFDRASGLLDEAGDGMIGVDDAFGGQFLQDLEPSAAGIDFVDAFAVDRQGRGRSGFAECPRPGCWL
jgi:hypothetical protein